MINTDRMQLPLKNWIGILGHEATHHLGYLDDQSRLPDRVGSELALHFQKRALESSLERFNRADARSLVFNSSGSRLTVGFLSAIEATIDIEWGSTPLAPLCRPDQTVVREFVGNPVWHINYLNAKTGVVTLRGGGFVNVMCADPGPNGKQTKQALLLGAMQDLHITRRSIWMIG